MKKKKWLYFKYNREEGKGKIYKKNPEKVTPHFVGFWYSFLVTDCICGANPKKNIFEKGEFSGHLTFYKKQFFFGEKKFFELDKQELYFFEKKHFSFFFFEKKCFLGKLFFRKNVKKFYKFLNFLWAENVLKFWKIFSKKHFREKHCFSKKRKMLFFQKNKVLVYRDIQFFLEKKHLFCKKLSAC